MRKESIVVFVIIILYIDSDFDGRTLFDDDAIADVFFFYFSFRKMGRKENGREQLCENMLQCKNGKWNIIMIIFFFFS